MKPDARTHRRTSARWASAIPVILAVLLCVGASVRPLRAQQNPAIKAAIQLAASGRGDSARRLVAQEMAKARPGDPAYVEALYWRGRLASSGDSAESDLRRVAIEYSNSAWADQALLQLAQLALAAGNGAGAFQLAERLRNDYPTSTLRSRAALWGGRAAFEDGDPVSACALLDSARTEAPDEVEFLNQVAFYRGRCAAVAARSRADSARPAPGAASPDTAHRAASPRGPAAAPKVAAPSVPAAAPVPQYEVQLRATRSARTAEALLARVTRAGLHAHIVKGSDGIRRVRAGPYASEREATEAAARLRRLLGGHPFVVPPS